VSGDLSLLLLTAVATAYGFWASLVGAPRRSVASWAAAALFLLIGVHAALVVTVSGPGEILPGHQLNPDLQQYWAAKLLAGELVAPRPEYLFGAILAALLALVARPAKATAWRVAPALLAFLFLYAAIDRREPVSFAVRSSGDATAYVTMIPKGRVLFSIGHGQDVFVPILHEKECGSLPPAPGLDWSRGREALFRLRSIRRHDRLAARPGRRVARLRQVGDRFGRLSADRLDGTSGSHPGSRRTWRARRGVSMADTRALESKVERCQEVADALRARLNERILGNAAVIDLTLTALLAGGHALLEGVPGIGKTRLVRSLAEALDARFSRIQFTPDLMPADVTGTMMLFENPEVGREFRFREGPVFANVLLADEINRATPKTQSAMLEAMEERQVTVDGKSRPLPSPFFTLATQNPLEMEGTYPLPEAQLDRFLFKIVVSTPSREVLADIIHLAARPETGGGPPVSTAAEIEGLIALVRDVVLTEDVRRKIAQLVLATHPGNADAPETVRRYVRHGASPRAALAIALGLKAKALMAGRAHAERSDIPGLFAPALRHRIALNFEGEAEGLTPDGVLADILERIELR